MQNLQVKDRKVQRVGTAVPDTRPVPLVVDLDGTLVMGNLLVEAILALIKRTPQLVFLLPLWLLRGRAALKQEVAQRVDFDIATILLNQPFLEHLKLEKARGRPLVVITGGPEKWANIIAAALGLFDEVLVIDDVRDPGRRETLALLGERFGPGGFDYAGATAADAPIWQAARRATLVNASPRLVRWAAGHLAVEYVLPREAARVATYLRALRVHQWLKNLLLFVPLVTALRFTDVGAIIQLSIGFFAFSLCASSVYLLNDILDVHDDRRHPRKRKRPFAAGELSLADGAILIPVLLAGAVLLATFLPPAFGAVLAIYYATTLAYSFKLKQLEVVDILALALLYTTRVFAGGSAADITLTFWLLAFAVFVFLSLALAKRCAELVMLSKRGGEAASGRGYRVADLPLLYGMGTGAGYVAALVLGLYINSAQIEHGYANPEFLWILVPLLVYWITRVWLKTYRGEMHDDPLVFAARDSATPALAAACGAALGLAI